MKRNILAGALAALALALCTSARAQSEFPTGQAGKTVVGVGGLCMNSSGQMVSQWNSAGAWQCAGSVLIAGTFSASLAGFTPTPSYSQLAASDTANHSVATPTGADDVISNLDTNLAYCNFGAASTTSTFPLPAGAAFGFHNGGTFATVQCNSPTSTLKITISGGAGLFSGGGGGGGGGGSGSNASVGATGSAVPGSATLGGMSVGGTMTAMPGTSNGLKIDGSAVTQPVSAASLPLPTGAATAALQTTGNTALSGINSTLGAPFQAGGSIGNSGFNALQGGAANASGNPFFVNCVSGCSGGGGGGSGGGATPQATGQATPLNITTTGTTLVIPATGSDYTYITFVDLFNSSVTSGSSGSVYLEYGTQTSTPCDTGATAFTPTFNLEANSGKSSGTGLGPIYTVPAGDQVCAVTASFTSSPTIGVGVSYTQSATLAGSFGGGSATAPFQPAQQWANLAAGASSARVAIPTNTGSIVVENMTANPACYALGTTSVTASTTGAVCTNGDFIGPNASVSITVSGGSPAPVDIAAIGMTTGLTTTLQISGGSGLGAGWSSGGSGASVGPTGSAVPASATLGGMSVAGSMVAIPGTANGVKVDNSAVVQPVSLPSDVPSALAAITAADANWTSTATGIQTTWGDGGSAPTAGSADTVSTNNAQTINFGLTFSGTTPGAIIVYVTSDTAAAVAANTARWVTKGPYFPSASGSPTTLTAGVVGGTVNVAGFTAVKFVGTTAFSGSGSVAITIVLTGNVATMHVSNMPIEPGSLGSNFPTASANISTATTTGLVTGVANKSIYFMFDGSVGSQATADGTFQFEYGTGSGCSSPTTIGPLYNFSAGNGVSPPRIITVPAGQSLCFVTGQAQPVQLGGSYAQQ